MTLEVGENFPRGGKKHIPTPTEPTNKIKNLFTTSSKPIKSKTKRNDKKKPKRKTEGDLEENISVAVADQLSYNKLQEGMLVLGCIKSVSDLKATVELPGKLYGTLHINSISDEFTEFLESIVSETATDNELVTLDSIFRRGQYVPIKILNIKEEDNYITLLLSTKPSVINLGQNHCDIKEGRLMWTAVSSLSDHGYQLTNGNKNCRIFLPFNKVEENRKLVVGEPLWCVVEKCDQTSSVSTMTVSALNEKVLSAKEVESVSLDRVIPGMAFTLLINKHVKQGIEVIFNDLCTGYVNEHYFKKCLESATNYQIGKTVLGRILYVQPTTKLTFFTLKSLEDVSESHFEIGSVTSAQVLNISAGIVLKLGDNKRGYVSFKRVLPPLSQNPSTNINEYVKKKFPLGSKHKCRILDHHHLDDVYFCTLQPNLIKEKWFSIKDAKIGQCVTAKIAEIKESGFLVTFGRLKGFISNIDLSNAQFSYNIKRKFFVGQIVQAKIWKIEEHEKIYLTLKQAFLESDKVLKSYEDAVVGEIYPGLVIKTYKSGVLFLFYGNVKGFLPQRFLHGLLAEEAFYIGQVVNVAISQIEKNQITLTLDLSNERKQQTKNSKKKIKNLENLNGETSVKENKTVKKEKNKIEKENVTEDLTKRSTKKKKKNEVKGKIDQKSRENEKNIDNSEDEGNASIEEELSSKEEYNDSWWSESLDSENEENSTMKLKELASKQKERKCKKIVLKSEKEGSISSEYDEGISSSSENTGTTAKESTKRNKKDMKDGKDLKKSKKRKIADSEDITCLKKIKTNENNNLKRKIKYENDDNDTGKKIQIKLEQETENLNVLLPGVNDFFLDINLIKKEKIESDSELDEEMEESERKKKRLTPAERKEVAKQQEEEIRRKEMELLEASENPQSADQFDRLLIAHPNSSKLWIQYMAFHIGNTQNDRARAVARKAIETIDMRESQEKLNVWLALLNLENRFGDKESFDKTFEEASRCNDSYEVYIETIKMLAESQRYAEMQEKIRRVKGKFKQDPRMWTDVAKIYYMCGRYSDARNLKQGALRSVVNKKEHIDLITKFAIMEFSYGEPEQGEALFETIIQSAPQRVDVWCTYVDQLVKQNKIELARRVLDRSICQKMPGRKIASLFKKYKSFEEKHGTQENIERLKQMAIEYTPIN